MVSLQAFTARAPGAISGWGTKIPQAAQTPLKEKKKDYLATKTIHKQQDKLIGISLQGNHGEGNGNPPQYSCLENPMEEEPGGPQSTRSRRVRHD